MNSRQRTLAAIKGEPHDRVPVAQHNFPFCLKHCDLPMDVYRRDPRRAAQALADTAEDFGYDCIIIDFDTCSVAEAMGSKLTFPAEEPARVERYALEDLDAIETLHLIDPERDARLPLWLETTRELRRIVGDEKAIMARADQGPFGLLFQLREGQELMMELITEDEAVLKRALEICTESGVRFARAQLAAGADLTSIGDSASGEPLISPQLYAQYAQPCQRRYKELLGEGLLSLHICGKTNNIIEGMVETGCDVLELDHYNDIAASIEKAGQRCSIWGNLDPSSVLAQGTPERVGKEARRVLEAAVARTWRFVLCPGCLINADTPPENLRAMTAAAERWGRYDKAPAL